MSDRSLSRLTRAERTAAQARERLGQTLNQIQDRLNPVNIINETSRELRARGLQAADQAIASLRSRPMLATAAVSALGWLISRRPGLALLLKLFLRSSATSGQTEHSINSRPQRSGRRRKDPAPVSASEETA